MKEIWEEFKLKCKEAWDTFVEGVLGVSKSTWKLLKDACVNFVTAIVTWLGELIKGVWNIFVSLISVIWAALIAALKSTIGMLYTKLIEWIKHW